MRAVLGLTIEEVDALLAGYTGNGTVVVANHNTEQQIIISGDSDGLDGLSELCREQGARVIPLKVSVANHSPLVAGAVEDFADYMQTVTFNEARIPLLFNATAELEKDPAAMRKIMASQIASKVRWYESINTMVAGGVEVFIELGPKNVLTGMMKKILPRKSSITCLQADTPESLDKAVAAIYG
jgi:[acyl-carrier-protein] S-malonyltransferase